MKYPANQSFLVRAVAAASVLGSNGALAQSADATPSTLEEVIVTGVAKSGISQFESSVAIATYNEQQMRELAPLTITDLYGATPGVWAETSGGESAANIFVRGIPAPGQFRFTKVQVDGLPTIEESGLPFTPPEGYVKMDPMLERVEFVRGGTGSIFASNSAGGIVNNIMRRGGPEFEGFAAVETSDFGMQRLEGYVAGPASDRLSYAVGGFWRQDTGVRDPGFYGNKGGQLRANLTYEMDRGDVTLALHRIDDRNLFYLPIPLDLRGGDLTSFPGFDANEGTLTSDAVRNVRTVLPGETRARDLSDGIRTDGSSASVHFDYELENWSVSNNARLLDGDTTFNAIFSLTPPEDARNYVDRRLADARAAFGPDVTDIALRFLGEGPGATSTFRFNSGDQLNGNNGNGFLLESGWWNVQTSVESFINDFSLSRAFGEADAHIVTLGLYTSFSEYGSEWNFNDILQEVRSAPNGLEAYAVNSAGDVVGALTQNSFTRYGSFYRNYTADVTDLAVYFQDEWQVNDALRVDFGFRYESIEIDGDAEQLGTFDLSDTNPLLTMGGLPTLADDAVTFGTGRFDTFDETYTNFSWSVGANYTFNQMFAAFARANDTVRTPDPNDLAANPAGAGAVPENEIFQAEVGVKIDHDFARAFVTAFYSDFTDQLFSDPIVDENGNTVEFQTLLESETQGVEAEIDVGPFSGVSVNIRATYQQPEIQGFTFVGGQVGGSAGSEFVGNTIQRIPETMLSITPRYEWRVGNIDGSVYFSYRDIDDRFANNGNTVILPGYEIWSVGATLNYGDLEVTFTGDNLDNAIGLTEGNPRSDAFAGGGSAGSQIATFGRPIVGRNFRLKLGYRF